jgi:CBS domain containing-hemolysin-like protein
MTGWNVLLILALVGLNGFFVAVEIAALAARRGRLDSLTGGEGQSFDLVRH